MFSFSLVAILIFCFLALPKLVFAQPVVDVHPPELPQFAIANLIILIIRLLVIAGFILAFIFLLIGGIRWITSAGDAKSVEGAKSMVTAATVGLILVVSAFAVIRLIEYFFQVSIISNSIPVPRIQ